MKLKLDENMPERVAPVLADRGHDVATVAGEGLGGAIDPVVAEASAEEGRMIITMDRRFADLRRHPPGRHPGMVVLRLRDQRPALVAAALSAFLDQHNLEGLAGCLVVVEPGAVRIRRP